MSILVLAGVDPSGAAGLRRDVWALAKCGHDAIAIPTCLTLQSRVVRADPIDDAWLADTLDDVVESAEVHAIKIGLVVHASVWRTLLPRVAKLVARGIPLVVDPVRGPSSGGFSVEAEGREILRDDVGPLHAILTPNRPELAWLASPPRANDDFLADDALQELLALGFGAVLLKGGHADSKTMVVDRLVSADGEWRYSRARREDGRGRRGTGCTLSSFLTAGLADGLDIAMAARVAGHRLQQVWNELRIG
ncbi:MAG: bifunctional hydroxymethylpyrimidine kinase/phosphomethylpyrimidine kinase [Planctomycetes bacterium]|nr:bifunctional hydroxymethylpyrimidine kinase/phosphomethylpyrimidine kinase [Planctomycetota bacterium]